MKKITAFVAAAVLLSSVSAAVAGGPMVMAEEPTMTVAPGASSSASGMILPLVGLGLVAALAASSSGSH